MFEVSYVLPAAAHPSELSSSTDFAVHVGSVFTAGVNEQPETGSHPELSELKE